ncbi:MAG: tetratricopeptide repeat protein, partial [Candidatus Omnitrophota bacterium]|nr:tetratricopeptide repeat protein [Candidatus Omnitrophota bacterium]
QAAFDRELTEARGLSKKRETEARSEYEKALAAKNVELKASLEKQKALSAKELKEAQSSSQAALKTREAEIKTEHEKTLAAKNAEFKTTLEKEAAKLKPREARLTALEADINKTEASLKDAREELKSREEDARKFKDIFNTEALKKKYPDIFGGKDAVKELRTSAAALKVRNAVNKAGLQRKILSEEAALARADIEKALIDKNNLKNNIASADKKISQLKGSIEEVKADMKSESDQAAAEEDRIKGLEDSLNKVAAQQKEVEARLLEAPKRTARIEDELKKAIIDIPKDSAPGFKTEGIKSLESELERSRNEEDSLKEKLRTAEKKVEDLKGTIISSRAKAKKELAARAAAGKQNIKSLEKDTAKIESQKKEFKKEYQRMMNKISVLQGKGRALSAGIKSKDAEIAGLKNIVAKEALKIKHAEEASAGPGRKAPGPADEAETALSAMMGKIDELKAMNARIEKDAASTKEAEQDAKRRAESEKQSADEAIRKTNKERLDMHYNLAVVFDKAGMYKEAEKEYARCLDINPNDAGVHYNLGILYDDKLNNNHKAGYHYKQYLSLKPKEVGAIQVRQWLINIELENRLGKETR